MNALPLKPGQTPAEIIDDLIANHGLKTVLLAIGGKLIKRTRPPDSTAGLDVRGQLHIDHLDDRLRADIGLDPKERDDLTLMLAHVRHKDLFHL